MADKKSNQILLQGKEVFLDEIQPKYFPYVIEWRNNKNLNRYLNHPQDLTLESQTWWYEQRYLQDETQGFLVMVDKSNERPFATFGWTDMDLQKNLCIEGRLLLGDSAYANSFAFLEGIILLNDYIYGKVETVYIHVGVENKKALRLNKRLGFIPNDGEIQFPHELFVNGDKNRPQIEMYRTKEMYQAIRKKLFENVLED